MAVGTGLRPNTTTSYVRGDLVSSLTGDFSLFWFGSVQQYPSSGSFANLIGLADSGFVENLGIALDQTNTNRLKIISNGNTPGSGTITINLNQDYFIELRYTSGTNTLELFVDGSPDYSVNPTNGATWIPTLAKYTLFSINGSSSFGRATMLLGTGLSDGANPANSLTPNPEISSELVLQETTNGQNGTLFNFIDDESQWYTPVEEFNSTTAPVPNVTETSVQGFARDANHFYMFNSIFNGDVNEIVKVDATTGSVVLRNNTPFSGLPAGDWKLNNGCESEGIIYNTVRDQTTADVMLVRYDSSDLSYISHTDIGVLGAFAAGCGVSPTDTLIVPGFSNTPGDSRTTEVTEVTKAGAFVATRTISEPIFGIQGVAYGNGFYYFSSHDTFNGKEFIVETDSNFNVTRNINLDVLFTEIEGIYFYNNLYYTSDIQQAPLTFTVSNIIPGEGGEGLSSSIASGLAKSISKSI